MIRERCQANVYNLWLDKGTWLQSFLNSTISYKYLNIVNFLKIN